MPDQPALSTALTSRLLQRYRIPIARQELVQSPSEAVSAARRIGLPVALKAVSPVQSHKTEAGLLRLNLSTLQEVENAAVNLLNHASGKLLEGLLVQEMVSGAVELIAGISRDAQFGPVLLLGSGGVLVELLEDVAMAVPPLTSAQVVDLLQQLHAWKLLQGFRGHPACDLPALQDLVVSLSRLAVENADRISSLDLNPVMVLPAGQGVRVVDARIFGMDKDFPEEYEHG